jgi:chemotaxis regulatin CheY-phosphate phosphatase CheZ
MHLQNLKSLLAESYNRKLSILNENILNDIMALILTPKLKKAMSSLKADPEFKELEKQIKLAKEELEAIAKRLERNLDKRKSIVADMNKAGIKVEVGMDSEQIYQAYKSWQTKENKKLNKPEWSKFFK